MCVWWGGGGGKEGRREGRGCGGRGGEGGKGAFLNLQIIPINISSNIRLIFQSIFASIS